MPYLVTVNSKPTILCLKSRGERLLLKEWSKASAEYPTAANTVAQKIQFSNKCSINSLCFCVKPGRSFSFAKSDLFCEMTTRLAIHPACVLRRITSANAKKWVMNLSKLRHSSTDDRRIFKAQLWRGRSLHQLRYAVNVPVAWRCYQALVLLLLW